MKKFLMLLAAVAVIAAPALSLAQTMTDYEYNRLTLSNTFANEKAKPILRNADRALHAPVATLALLSDIEYDARYQGMMVNVDTGLYFYDATDCGIGATSPTAVAPDDTVGCWYLISGAADIWATLADTTPTSGASLIGIKDTATYYTGTDVETALAEIGAEFLTKQDLAVPAAVGNVATLDALGQVTDSTHALAEYQILTVPAAAGNLAGLTALGALEDSGVAAADVQVLAVPTAAGNVCTLSALGAVEDSTIASANLQVLTIPASAGNLAELSALGALADSGVASADVQILTVPTAAGNIATLDVAGALTDSGVLATNVQVLTAPAAADNLAGLDATGALTDSAIAGADVSALLAVFADQMRNSTDTAQSLADATETLLDLEDVELAGDVTYDAGVTSLATIPVGGTGVYAVVYGATFAAGAGTYNKIAILVNGASRSDTEETPDGANPTVVEDNTKLYLTAADTVGLYATQDSGGALNVTAAYMAIQRIQ